MTEDEEAPMEDEVPAPEAPEVRSAVKMSPWVDGTPTPRSMKRDRSFLSRAWISSGFPKESEEASHLRNKDLL